VKLRLLCHYEGPVNCMPDSPQLSWACRELGADIKYFRGCPERLDQLCHGCDVVVYWAVMNGPDLPSIAAFRRARNKCRLVAMFGDGGCPECVPLLQTYKDQNVFDAAVNIDGHPDWPHREGIDWTCFGVFDDHAYRKVLPRTRRLGYSGGGGPHREGMVRSLADVIDAVVGYDANVPYQRYADWMLSTYAVVNTSWSATRPDVMCGKGRMNEAALAGCLLFETKGSCLRDYYEPGEDYLEYGWDSPGNIHARDILDVVERPDFEEYAEIIGQRFRTKTLSLYGPERFWNRIVRGSAK
jgi:hypothetical protein